MERGYGSIDDVEEKVLNKCCTIFNVVYNYLPWKR